MSEQGAIVSWFASQSDFGIAPQHEERAQSHATKIFFTVFCAGKRENEVRLQKVNRQMLELVLVLRSLHGDWNDE